MEYTKAELHGQSCAVCQIFGSSTVSVDCGSFNSILILELQYQARIRLHLIQLVDRSYNGVATID